MILAGLDIACGHAMAIAEGLPLATLLGARLRKLGMSTERRVGCRRRTGRRSSSATWSTADRQVDVVSTGRSMIHAGHPRSAMGNHEFNAIATARHDAPGEFLPRHDQERVAARRVPAASGQRRSLPPVLASDCICRGDHVAHGGRPEASSAGGTGAASS